MFQRKLEDDFFSSVGVWCRTIFTFIFGKNENKEDIKNNIGAEPLDQNFNRSQTMEVQKKRLSQFLLIVIFILWFYFYFIKTVFPSLIGLYLL